MEVGWVQVERLDVERVEFEWMKFKRVEVGGC